MYSRKEIIPGHVFSAQNKDEYDFIFKYIVIGNMSVGKSCLIHRFTKNSFSVNGTNTLGLAFSTRTIVVANKAIKIHLWDTAGLERFRAVTRSAYRGAHGALLVYDITDRTSFENLGEWLNEIEQNTNTNPVIFLIGNKADMRNNREVTYIEGSEFAAKHGLMFAEISAKTGSFVDDSFYDMARKIYRNMEKDRLKMLASQKSQIKLSKETSPEKKPKWRCW